MHLKVFMVVLLWAQKKPAEGRALGGWKIGEPEWAQSGAVRVDSLGVGGVVRGYLTMNGNIKGDELYLRARSQRVNQPLAPVTGR